LRERRFHFRERNLPFGERSSRFREWSFRFREWNFPFGERSFPFGERNFPFGEWKFPFGEWNFPFGERNFRFRERNVRFSSGGYTNPSSSPETALAAVMGLPPRRAARRREVGGWRYNGQSLSRRVIQMNVGEAERRQWDGAEQAQIVNMSSRNSIFRSKP